MMYILPHFHAPSYENEPEMWFDGAETQWGSMVFSVSSMFSVFTMLADFSLM